MADGLSEEMRNKDTLRSEKVECGGGGGNDDASSTEAVEVFGGNAEDEREANRQRIIRKYPNVFGCGTSPDDSNKLVRPVYWEFSYGWDDLIETLADLISKELERQKNPKNDLPFSVLQMKEKFGGLRFYVFSGNDRISGFIDMAEAQSYKTCEVCGNKGTMCRMIDARWYRTLCPCCANKDGYRKLNSDNQS